ncbi:hypothetical protein [Paraburkholderia bryophila]|uniref:Matrixin n=1 Tax=Paraburkholderia bryophila TaxID=420952 RepID=A0A7Y9WQV4_9BURK|nr:hypothetical protein [Paraburkholderia bryophila]NYH24233.1 hypothetical protein [Paraburkholderia bryophila]
MNLSSRASYLVACLAACSVTPASADTLTLADSVVYGRVSRMGPKSIQFMNGCMKDSVKEFPVDSIRRIEINGSCLPKPPKPYSAGGALCDKSKLLYRVEFNDSRPPAYASQVEFANARVHFVDPDGLQVHHDNLKKVAAISRQLVCDSAIPAQEKQPPSVCTEPVQWAVNFSYEPVMGNRIFTQGFSFYLVDDDGHPIATGDEISDTVRKSFQIALTWWTSAIYDRKATLSPDARAAIEKMVSHSESGGYVLLTPPQVIQKGCPDGATFVVRYAKKSDAPFRDASDGSIKAARAEVEGRTLLVNGVDYPCWKAEPKKVIALPPDTMSKSECFNLVPVMTHELGHAFGLEGHKDDPNAPSVMDSVIRMEAPYPTAADADSLVTVLTKPIQGMLPGRIDADGRGVRLK